MGPEQAIQGAYVPADTASTARPQEKGDDLGKQGPVLSHFLFGGMFIVMHISGKQLRSIEL
jgi:hypothetical protein